MANDPKPTEICKKCNKSIDPSSKVAKCDKCQSSFHDKCVRVNDNMPVWSCIVCNQGEGSSLVPLLAPRSQRSRKSSRQSSSTTSSKAQAVLEAIEEEKILLEKQAHEKIKILEETHQQQLELVRKKQETLIELGSKSSLGSRNSLKGVGTVSSVDKVKTWINSTSVNKEQPEEVVDKSVRFCHKSQTIFQKDFIPSSTQITLLNHHTTPNTLTRPKNNLSTYTAAASKGTAPNDNVEATKSLTREEIAARHVVKDLPMFDGNPRLWPKFISSYHRSTKVCGFTNIENLERLSKALKDDAYESVKSSLVLDENVPNILATLELLYGRPEFIINGFIDDLRKTPLPTYDSIDSIIRYSLDIESISMTMVKAELAEHLWNPALLSEIVGRLPMQLKMDWASFRYGEPPCSIELFSMWLKNKAVSYASILTKPPKFKRYNKSESNKHLVNIHQSGEEQKCFVCTKKCSSLSDCEKFKNMKLNEKWTAVRQHKICRICLKKHIGQLCQKDTKCGVDGCEFLHNKLLHKMKKEASVDNVHQEVSAVNMHEGPTTYFKILPVYISNENKKVMTYAMFDDGSSITLLDDSIARLLCLKGEDHPLCLRWTNGVERRDDHSMRVNVKISQHPDGRQFELRDVRTLKNLQLPRQTVNMEVLSATYSHLKNINFKSMSNVRPMILIGLNHPKLLTVQRYRFGDENDPVAAKTPLGWCLFGPRPIQQESILNIQKCDCGSSERRDNILEDMVRQNYSLDAIGVSNPSSVPQSKEDERALRILRASAKFNHGRYEIGLLWKYNKVKLPNSLPMATRRLHCLEKKCRADPELRSIINKQIEEYVTKGYAVRLNGKYSNTTDVWYLPIFVVKNPNKPDKVRIVWDAAAAVDNVSLNDVLLKGPDFLSSLPAILLRFRERKIAVTGDIKEMFHQILVKKDDRRFQRFLWRMSEREEVQVYEMCVMTFGASCSPSSSQYIKNLNAERFKDDFPEAVEAIQKNHYVDDWLQSVDSEDEAVTLAKDVKKIHSEGGFQIHKWISNVQSVVQCLNGDTHQAMKNLSLSPKFEADKVLGLFWTTSLDVFQFILKVHESNECIIRGGKIPTKREILRILMSIFDPLGLVTPVLIYPKILLQSIWRSKIKWDDDISEDHHIQWKSWCQNLHHLPNISIPRWIGLHKNTTGVEVHTFVDASEDAFCAAVYFKVIDGSSAKCSLIMSKSRVSPIKSLSIPRLELQAAVLGARLSKFVLENSSSTIPFSKKFYWTDSETVIKWLNSDSRRYTQYVSCRIGEILETSRHYEWNWISGKQNVADMGTKLRLFDDDQISRWFQGPQFLLSDNYPEKHPNEKICEEELRPKAKIHPIAIHEESEFRVEKWRKLRRIYAFVFRFLLNLKCRLAGKSIQVVPLSKLEYVLAENYLIKKAQIENYSQEYSLLKDGKQLDDKRSQIFKESPFIDNEGILRARSRVQATYCTPYMSKNPILLPKDHKITNMILHFYHEKFHHMYVSTVANEVKQKFVVPRLKVKLKEIQRLCQFCKNRDAHPNVPEECELLSARITPFTRPFTFVGIDYFGPLQVVIGRRTEKRWVMLITCLTIRALHLEVVHSLSSDSCILALNRFINRRGKPRQIYTDNGTNFRGSRRELREIWNVINKNKVAESFIDPDTEWMFIPPASPHMGGAWERMVRTVKTSLNVVMPEKIKNDELLVSMLTEVENIINNRPLTHVEIDKDELEALTPNHFLLGSTSGVKPIGKFSDESVYLKANWQKSQKFANMFWKR